uniref:Uncharacterized protein n=1 Tax=Meloidogyne enterolobii TaxID=390850 RepID=A0A6V7WYV5_MELEN|nr:unnamed protein product [Meloidogyne enterolobii]
MKITVVPEIPSRNDYPAYLKNKILHLPGVVIQESENFIFSIFDVAAVDLSFEAICIIKL